MHSKPANLAAVPDCSAERNRKLVCQSLCILASLEVIVFGAHTLLELAEILEDAGVELLLHLVSTRNMPLIFC